MEREPDARPGLVVRIIGRIGFRSPPVDFFIDGQPAGAMKGVSARYLPTGVGVHRVSARVGFLRSRGLVLSLASGELVSLECGFHRYRIVRTAAPAALILGSLLFLYLKLYYASITIQFLAVGAMFLDMVMIFVPGSSLYLRRSAMPVDAATVLERMDAPSPTVRPEPGKRQFQFSVRALVILVACCALLTVVARELWDRRPSNQAARADSVAAIQGSEYTPERRQRTEAPPTPGPDYTARDRRRDPWPTNRAP